MRQAYLASSFLFNIVLEVVDSTNVQEKEVKGIKTKKEEIKMSLFTDNLTVYEKKRSEFNKVARPNVFPK